jgi:hypothetical protein
LGRRLVRIFGGMDLDFFAVDFFAVDFFAVDFFAVDFFAVDFFAVGMAPPFAPSVMPIG